VSLFAEVARVAAGGNCLVCSFGSNANFEFEEAMLKIAPNCEVRIFDPTDYSTSAHFKRLKAACPDKMHCHAVGLKSGCSAANKSGVRAGLFSSIWFKFFKATGKYETLQEIMEQLGHEG